MGHVTLVHGVAVLALAWPGACWKQLTADRGDTAPDTSTEPATGGDDAADGDDEGAGDDGATCEAQACPCTVDEASPPCDAWRNDGPGVSRGSTFGATFAAQGSDRVVMNTRQEVFTSDDKGLTWRMTASAPPGVSELYPSAHDSGLYATSRDGLYRSTDAGDSWDQVGLSGLSLTGFAPHPSEPQRLFAAISGAGVARSANAGQAWNADTQNLPDGFVRFLSPNPNRPEELLALSVPANAVPAAGATWPRALVRSTNGGESWTVVKGLRYELHAIARCPSDPETVWANQAGDLLKSTDGGQTWRTVPVPPARHLHQVSVRGANCERVFAALSDTGVVRSLDGGQTWEGPFSNGIDMPFIIPTGLTADTDGNVLVMSSYVGAYRSQDSGQTWELLSGIGRPVVRALVAGGEDGQTLLLQTHGMGLWYKLPGQDWQLNRAFTDLETRGATLAVSPHDPLHIIGGHLHSFDGGASWVKLAPNRVTDVAFHPDDPLDIVIASQMEGVHRSSDGGASYQPINGDLASQAGTSLRELGSRAIARLAETLYVGTPRLGIWESRDGGAHWTLANPTLAGSGIRALVTGGGKLVATANGSGVHVLEGQTWRAHNAGLEDLSGGTLLYDPGTDLWFLSVGGQVYRSDLEGAWAPTSNCKPDVGAITIMDDGEHRRLVGLGPNGLRSSPL